MAVTIILVIIIALIMVFGIRSTIKHSTGKGGGCCGDGSTSIRDEKKLENPVTATRTFYIEGMSCENCENRICRAVNRIDGAAVSSIKWKKGTAVVEFDRDVDAAEVIKKIEELDYKVTAVD